MSDTLIDQLQKVARAKRAVGRTDLAVLLQTRLESGYDVAGYLANGVDAVVLNGWNWRGALQIRQESSTLAASFLSSGVPINVVSEMERQRVLKASHGFSNNSETPAASS